MASGSTLFVGTARDRSGPATNAATLDTRNEIPVLEFDETTNEYADFEFTIPSAYTTNAGVTVRIGWTGDTAQAGNVLWSAAFKPFHDDSTDMDSATFTTAVSGAKTVNSGSAGEIVYDTLAFTSAQFGTMQAGEFCQLRIMRDAANSATDTLVGDAQLVSIEVLET